LPIARFPTKREPRTRAALLAIAMVVVAVALPATWWLGSPLVIDRTFDEGFPIAAAPAQGHSASAEPAAGRPTALSAGRINEIDAIPEGDGTTTDFALPDGKRVLRFEGVTVTNGSDLFVHLSGHPPARRPATP
jgi:hypothetical protein